MAIKLQITCSHCGEYLRNEDGEESLDTETIDDLQSGKIIEQVEKLGWIVQVNGDYLDTYCSARCAK